MEKDPQKEIFVDPQNSIIMDGLGFRALCAGELPTVDRDGKEVVNFIIKPDSTVRKRYNWRLDHEIDSLGNKKITIAQIDLIPLNIFDDSNRMWLYVKSFNHDETPLSKREEYLKKEIERLRKEKDQLEAENLRLSEVNDILRQNPEMALKASSEVYQNVLKSVSGILKKEEK